MTETIHADGQILTREEWLAERRKSIGASDCPAIMGRSPYKTILQLYADKLGLLPDEPPNESQEEGLYMEPFIIGRYERRVGIPVERRQVFVRHPTLPWMTCTLDGIRADGRPVELKNVAFDRLREWGDEGTDEVPEHVLLQVHHQMICTGEPRADVAARISGRPIRVHTVEADPEIAGMIVAAESKFVEMLRSETPPPPTGDDCRVMMLLYPEPYGLQRWDEEWASAAEMWEAIGRQMSSMQEQRDILKSQILGRLGDAEAADLPDGRRLKRSIVQTKEHVVKGSTSQRISLSKAKARR